MRTHGPDCRVFDTEADLQTWLDSPGGGSLWGRGDPDEYVRDNLVGTAEQVAEKAQEFVDAGLSRSSCCGSATSRRRRAWKRSRTRSCRTSGSERSRAALGFASVTALSDVPASRSS